MDNSFYAKKKKMDYSSSGAETDSARDECPRTDCRPVSYVISHKLVTGESTGCSHAYAYLEQSLGRPTHCHTHTHYKSSLV